MHSIYNIEYSVLEKIPTCFHNRSDYGYHFIIKKLAEKLVNNDTLGESYEKYLIFKVPIENKVMKMGKKLPKKCLTDYNLLIVQDLQEAHY